MMSMSLCVSVCLSASMSPEPHAQSLPNFLCMLPMAVAQSSSGRVIISHGEGAVLGVFFPIDNALYSIAFGTHTKTAELIDMPFGLISGLGPTNSVLHGGDDPQSRRGTLEENVPDKPNC